MYVMIIGGGRTGTQLAIMLLDQQHQVHLIENRRDVLARVHRELPTEVIYEGNPFDPEVLEQAKIREAQVLAAVTTSDEMNLALCYFAREHYGVKRTIARVNNPRNAWLFDETFHVDVVVNQTEMMATLIEEEMSMGDMMTLMKLRRGHLSLVEERILDGARAIGVAIKDLGLPDHCVIAAIIRNGEVTVPRGVSTLQEGDDVMAVVDAEGEEVLSQLFSSPNSKSQ
ncbi:MAG TPA: NAD-binding protein [Anaerolineaceae bacterium]